MVRDEESGEAQEIKEKVSRLSLISAKVEEWGKSR
jgi:hypothetical protein